MSPPDRSTYTRPLSKDFGNKSGQSKKKKELATRANVVPGLFNAQSRQQQYLAVRNGEPKPGKGAGRLRSRNGERVRVMISIGCTAYRDHELKLYRRWWLLFPQMTGCQPGSGWLLYVLEGLRSQGHSSSRSRKWTEVPNSHSRQFGCQTFARWGQRLTRPGAPSPNVCLTKARGGGEQHGQSKKERKRDTQREAP